MDDPSRYHWYGEEPFPWLGLGICALGFTTITAAAATGAWVFVTQFWDLKPLGVN